MRKFSPEFLRGLIGFLLICSVMEGHGRNSTVIRAAVQAAECEITIHAVMSDLLQVGGVRRASWKRMEKAERRQVLTTCAEKMAARFCLVHDQLGPVSPLTVRTELDDTSFSEDSRESLDQQMIAIKLHYAFPLPPERLTFWQEFATATGEESIHSQVMIRKDGELVMFPAALGDGLLLSYSFDWEAAVDPIANRSSLDSAVCGWENRPANAVVHIEEQRFLMRVFLPLPLLGEELDEMTMERMELLKERVREAFTMSTNNQSLPLLVVGGWIHPLNGESLHPGTSVSLSDGDKGLLEVEMFGRIPEGKQAAELTCSLLGNTFPVLYLAVCEEPGILKFLTMKPENNSTALSF